MKLGGSAGQSFHSDRADDASVHPGHPERAGRAAVAALQVVEIRHLGRGVPDEVVLGEHAADELDDGRPVRRTGRLDDDKARGHGVHRPVGAPDESSGR